MSDSTDRNLLFGILALQMDFIDREQLVAAMNAWVLEKGKPLGKILVEQSALKPDTHALLVALVDIRLKAGNVCRPTDSGRLIRDGTKKAV